MAGERPIVEHVSLPKIIVRARGYREEYSAYVNAYVVSPEYHLMASGHRRRSLWYLSLVGPRGSGTTLQAIFNTLVSTNVSKEVWIDDVGQVSLGHREQRLHDLGWGVHWNYEQTIVGNDLHGIMESRILTTWDPTQVILRDRDRDRQKGERSQGQGQGQKKAVTSAKRKPKEQVSMSSAIKFEESFDELEGREKNPLFLLLSSDPTSGEQRSAEQFLCFLDKRIPWPLHEDWTSFLWQRGIDQKETEELEVYSYTPKMPGDLSEEEQAAWTPDVLPTIQKAYLCYPNVTKLAEDLKAMLQEQSNNNKEKEEESPPALTQEEPHTHEEEIAALERMAMHDALAMAGFAA